MSAPRPKHRFPRRHASPSSELDRLSAVWRETAGASSRRRRAKLAEALRQHGDEEAVGLLLQLAERQESRDEAQPLLKLGEQRAGGAPTLKARVELARAQRFHQAHAIDGERSAGRKARKVLTRLWRERRAHDDSGYQHDLALLYGAVLGSDPAETLAALMEPLKLALPDSHPSRLRLRFELLERLTDPERAEAVLTPLWGERASVATPSLIEGVVRVARLARHRQDTDRALRWWRRAAELTESRECGLDGPARLLLRVEAYATLVVLAPTEDREALLDQALAAYQLQRGKLPFFATARVPLIQAAGRWVALANPTDILRGSHGVVETVADLTSETIFGPRQDYTCACGIRREPGRHQGFRFADDCPTCGVEVLPATVRRLRWAHITLRHPVLHPGCAAYLRSAGAAFDGPAPTTDEEVGRVMSRVTALRSDGTSHAGSVMHEVERRSGVSHTAMVLRHLPVPPPDMGVGQDVRAAFERVVVANQEGARGALVEAVEALFACFSPPSEEAPTVARHPALEDAILADRGSVGAWRAYADWLRQEGDPRGDLLAWRLSGDPAVEERAVCELVAGEPLAAILKDHQWTDFSEYSVSERDEVTLTWRDGFIIGLACDALSQDGLAELQAVLQSAASVLLERLAVRPGGEAAFETVAEHAERLAGLRVLQTGLSRVTGELLHTSPLPVLEELVVRLEPRQSGEALIPVLQQLVAAARLPRLRRLELHHVGRGGDGAVDAVLGALLDGGLLPQLEGLVLRGGRISDPMARRLVESLACRDLQHLELPLDGLAPDAWDALTTALPKLQTLERLMARANG